MFDTVLIDRNLLPITDAEYESIDLQTGYDMPFHEGFQSKCFENTLTFIKITDTHLEVWKYDPLWEGTDYTHINHRFEPYEYEDDWDGFNFYSFLKNGRWIEFTGKYVDGKLVVTKDH